VYTRLHEHVSMCAYVRVHASRAQIRSVFSGDTESRNIGRVAGRTAKRSVPATRATTDDKSDKNETTGADGDAGGGRRGRTRKVADHVQK